MNLIPEKEIACHSYANAITIMESLLEEGYVVMMSREEKLYIINYIWSPNYGEANRNDVVFVSRDEYEEEMFRNDE